MNFVKRLLVGGGTRAEVGASGGVRASLLPALDFLFALASSSCSLEMSAGGLTQGLHRVVQDLQAIVKDGGLNMIFPNWQADSLGIELLE